MAYRERAWGGAVGTSALERSYPAHAAESDFLLTFSERETVLIAPGFVFLSCFWWYWSC